MAYYDMCELCGAMSELHINFPYCRECGSHTCADCYMLDSEQDEDGRTSCICIDCEIDNEFGEPEEATDVDFET